MTHLSVDIEAGKIYWTDQLVTSKSVQRANLDGSNLEDVISGAAGLPMGVAIDGYNEKLYWTEYGTGTINRSNLDGTGTSVRSPMI